MDVVVVGGGVAGTVSALALARTGARVRLSEAYADPGGAVGSYLSLATNGLRALDVLGCLERVQARGFPVARQLMWTGSGRLLGNLPRARTAEDPLHSVTLLRSDLVDELRGAAREAGVELVTGERLTTAATGPDGRIRAEYAGGLRVDADLLVGADGIWSPVRGLLNPGLDGPQFAGQYTISGVSVGVAVEPDTFNLAFCRDGAFLWVATPSGEVWWQAQVTSATPPPRSGVSDGAWLDRLRTLYQGEPVPVRLFDAATRVHPVIVNHYLGEVPTWYGDRMVLVGDAAHPVGAGQGASMAIEDGLALAAELAAVLADAEVSAAPEVDTGDRIRAALARYEEIRRPRIRRVLKMAGDNRRVKQSGPVKRRMEQLFMPYFFRNHYAQATAWLFGEQPPALPRPADR